MTKYYIDNQGNYVGGFDGVKPPEGSIEVLTPPLHAAQKYKSNAWLELELTDSDIQKKLTDKWSIEIQLDALRLAIKGDQSKLNLIEDDLISLKKKKKK